MIGSHWATAVFQALNEAVELLRVCFINFLLSVASPKQGAATTLKHVQDVHHVHHFICPDPTCRRCPF
jgi:hypothetical protein